MEQPGPADDGNRATNIAGGDRIDGNTSVTENPKSWLALVRRTYGEPEKPTSFIAGVEKYKAEKAAREAAGASVATPVPRVSVVDDDRPRLERWATAALEGEANRVAAAASGGRNDQLNKSAFRLGQIVAHGLLNPDAIVESLIASSRANGYLDDRSHGGEQAARASIHRSINDGTLAPCELPVDVFGNIKAWGDAQRAAKAAQDAPGATETAPTRWDELAADTELARAVKELQTRRRAKEIDAEIEAAKHPKPAPDAGTLAEMLGRPLEPSWRIEGLLPAGGRMLWSAPRKTGKTTALGNLSESLLTGEPFLGTYAVRPITGRVVFLNYEVTGAQLAAWMHDMGIPADRLYLINMRGRGNLLADEAGRAELVAMIRAAEGEVLIVDPFGRAFNGKSQNDAAEVTPWLVRLDEVAEQAGISEVILTAHAGWEGERTRGSSALEDWPDVIVTMTADADSGQRFIKAVGRDVDLDEDALDYDATTRRLSLTGSGSRKQVRASGRIDGLAKRVVEIVTATPGINVAAINAALHAGAESMQKGDENKACQKALDLGLIRRERGPRNSWLHYAASVPPSTPDYPPGSLLSTPDPPLGGVGTQCTTQTSSTPEAAA